MRPLRNAFPANYNLDILIDSRQQLPQSFDGEARELVVAESGDLRLRDSQYLRGIRPRQLTAIKHLIQRVSEAQPTLTFGGVGETKVGEQVSSATAARFFTFGVSISHCASNGRRYLSVEASSAVSVERAQRRLLGPAG